MCRLLNNLLPSNPRMKRKYSLRGRLRNKNGKMLRKRPRTSKYGTRKRLRAGSLWRGSRTPTSHLLKLKKTCTITTLPREASFQLRCTWPNLESSSPETNDLRITMNSQTKRRKCSWSSWLTTPFPVRSTSWKTSKRKRTRLYKSLIKNLKQMKLNWRSSSRETKKRRRKQFKKWRMKSRRRKKKKRRLRGLKVRSTLSSLISIRTWTSFTLKKNTSSSLDSLTSRIFRLRRLKKTQSDPNAWKVGSEDSKRIPVSTTSSSEWMTRRSTMRTRALSLNRRADSISIKWLQSRGGRIWLSKTGKRSSNSWNRNIE